MDEAIARRYGRSLWRMSRPTFLLGTLPLYLLGTAAGWERSGSANATVAAVGLLLVWSIQLATHYNNEYRDVETDRQVHRPTRVSGGSRVLVEDAVPPNVARFGAFASIGLTGALLVLLTGWFGVGPWLPVFTGVGLLIGWYYSAPPLALSRRGVGEFAAATVAGILVPATAYYLQQSTTDLVLLRRSLPVGVLLFALTVATAIPDVDADRATGKLTLTARLGRRNAAHLQGALWAVGWLGSVAVVWNLDATLGVATLIAGIPLAVVEFHYLPIAGRGVASAAERMAIGNAVTVGLVTTAIVVASWT